MKRFMILMTVVLSAVVIVPAARADIQAPENPVHERRKAWLEKNKHVYGYQPGNVGIGTTNAKATASTDAKKPADKDDGKGDTGGEDVLKGKSAAEKQGLLTELMKQFDTDGDGVISYKEMEAAKDAGKERLLKALLNEATAKAAKKKSEKKKSAESAPDASVPGTIDPTTGMKTIVVQPSGS